MLKISSECQGRAPLLGRKSLAGSNGHGEAVGRRRERAGPPRVVDARRVVRKVEVQHETSILRAEIRTLYGIEQVPPRAVGLGPARGLTERQEDSAPVAFAPVELDRQRPVQQAKSGDGEPHES